MVKFLSEEWLEEMHRLAGGMEVRPGATVRLQYQITGGPEGDVPFYWIVEDGKLTDTKMGEVSNVEVTLTETYDDAMLIWKGELDPQVAFMQGRMKVTGDMARLMSLLPLTNSTDYKEVVTKLAEVTEF